MLNKEIRVSFPPGNPLQLSAVKQLVEAVFSDLNKSVDCSLLRSISDRLTVLVTLVNITKFQRLIVDFAFATAVGKSIIHHGRKEEFGSRRMA